MKQFLNASEVAKLLNVDRATVTRWIQRGWVGGAVQAPQSREWRIPLSAYARLAANQHEGHRV